MKPLSLEKAFNIAFFEKDSFQNFLSFEPFQQTKFITFDERLIAEPTSKLKEYHKFINEFILSYLKVNKDVVFSYRKGSSTYDAVKLHACSKIFFNTDIKSFFPSITREYARSVLVDNLSNVPISDLNIHLDKILDYIIIDNSLPVGFPTSPAFSNACLYDFDVEMQQYCINHEYIFTRYSDDIIISSENDEGFENIHSVVSDLLGEFGKGHFKLNSAKTKLIKKGSKIKLLGMVILPSQIVSVDIKIKRKLEHLIHFYVTDKDKFIDSIIKDPKVKTSGLNDSEILEKGVNTVSGLLNHINTIDKSYLDKLKRKYGNTIVDMLFYKNVN
ncbi:TPA: reverse transcriptase family protein [Escherichia coli]|uniref:reverse transcriptase family protein n=2 Tax=Escherichia coli TaxID=562 RepID=UPI0022480C63|nr:reverse transcriptase family protein [Escherichia coli]EKP5774752.1 RNA-directed DNA polymerase [Escherichia coli]MCX2396634.1 reverse transcriptase family protein [Escherichia coli]MDF5759544.1 reverse transcriptase family protein [Escherichia coli]MEB6269997.1 reverse transcriptase family protein [Escherichia coli]MEC6493486.1 reverse transcriptase family protein [Escherichia coli]